MYKNEKFWNRIAKHYASAPIEDKNLFEKTISDVQAYLKIDDKLLDFGCGTGTYSIAIADNVKTITAIDFSKSMIDIARSRGDEADKHNIDFMYMSLFDEYLKGGDYDVVLTFNVFHLQEDLDKVIQRIYQLLKPQGRLFCKSVCMGRSFKLVTPIINFLSRFNILPRINAFTHKELEASLEKHHLKVVESKDHAAEEKTRFIVAEKVVAKERVTGLSWV